MEGNGLFESAMKGRWNEVVEAYQKSPNIRDARITRSEDTFLHIAVSNGRTEIVLKLVEIIGKNASKMLHIKNERGNTPLHLAAALGNVKMCYFLATKDGSLIRARNTENETPLFLSALHGKKKAFLCLHFLYKQVYTEVDYSLCRKSNGDTILHSAISGEYFSLAFQIIHDYPDLIDSVNEAGQLPLHILASKPNSFRSGAYFPPVDRLIYSCIIIRELQEETFDTESCLNDSKVNTDPKYPQSYETCMNFIYAIKTCVRVITRRDNNSFGRQVRHILVERKENNENGELKDEEKAQQNINLSNGRNIAKNKRKQNLYPPNYATSALFFKVVADFVLIILGFGISNIKYIRQKKERHVWATQIMNKLVRNRRASLYKYEDHGRDPIHSRPKAESDPSGVFTASPSSEVSQNKDKINSFNSLTADYEKHKLGENKQDKPMLVAAKLGVTEMVDRFFDAYPAAIQEFNTTQKNLVLLTFEKKETHKFRKKETPILIAAKMGVTEIVDKILDLFPMAIQDLDSENKNAVLLAVEHRQTDVYILLLKKEILKESVFRQLDKCGNSALHLAAKLGDYKPRLIPGAALQMQWEIKWYKFVKNSMPRHFFVKHNKEGQTPKEIFTATHKELVMQGTEWLTKTSESCSVVAALIATVAFATSATVPGGVDQTTGSPILENEPGFNVFAIASLMSLCFSVTALIFFLTILTSRYQEDDFAIDLPRKLFLGLTSLFTSIASVLLSFCAGHFFVLKKSLRYAAYPMYAATCLPLTFFALAQLPLYYDLVRAILKKEPQ
ncbi:Ankyrin-repeat containing protein [Euphorbia peplus]|nr:Ankyrin-repeat containing protein [Euphorbia peplus]